MIGKSFRHQRLLMLAGSLLMAIPVAVVGEVLQGHNGAISYDTETGNYILEGFPDPVPAAEVERNLSGALCSNCHPAAVDQLKDSVHFKVQGPNPRILFPGGGAHGALDRACGLPGTSALINYNSDINLGECGKCHVGRFIPPMEGAFTSMFAQMGLPNPAGQAKTIVEGGLDCLICHGEHYLSVRDDLDWENGALLQTHTLAGYAEPGEHSPSPQGYANLFRDNTDFDHDGQYDPLLDVTGDGVPDMCLPIGSNPDGSPICGWPTVGQDRSVEAVLSVGTSDEHACLRCHEHARTGYKRGTLFRPGYDVHATVCFDDGVGGCVKNTCTACHRTNLDIDGDFVLDIDAHKFVRGHLVGGDLAAADYPPPPPGVAPDPDDPTHLTCVQCHATSGPGGLPGIVHSPQHLGKIACETCHITQSAGITYSMYGHGGHVSFGRNEDGLDTKIITLDHMVADDEVEGDVDNDFAAFKLNPVLMWFNGSTSFLAQSLAVRGAANAKITPFKPMANGMAMDGRFFQGDYSTTNKNGEPYNAYSMYRFYATAEDCDNLQLPGTEPFTCGTDGLYGNAEVFSVLRLLGTQTDEDGNIIVQGMTPEDVRLSSLFDLMDMTRPDKQTMAMMHVFPNLLNFSKSGYMYEHYLVSTELAGEPEDADGNGILDAGADFLFDILSAVNVGLEEFKGFNVPMFLPSDYDWYPPMTKPSEVATMKLPDGKFMKLFLGMQLQAQGASMEEMQQLIGSYPSFSNGVTLGGHGVVPDPGKNALGSTGGKFNGCLECHGEDGVLTKPVPVTEEVMVDVGMPAPAGMPVYRWVYYNVKNILDLGLTTNNEDVVNGSADIDIADEPALSNLVRKGSQRMVLNWFMPTAPLTLNGQLIGGGYRPFTPASSGWSLFGTRLRATDLTWSGGAWMPVLEPVTTPAPNYAVLGYAHDDVIWPADDPRLNEGPGGGGGGGGAGGAGGAGGVGGTGGGNL
jgi:hypothetical protein